MCFDDPGDSPGAREEIRLYTRNAALTLLIVAFVFLIAGAVVAIFTKGIDPS